MRSAWTLACAVVAMGCSGSPGQPAPEAPSVVVPAIAVTTASPLQPAPAPSVKPVASPFDALASCVGELRQAGWLAHKGDPARAGYEEALREELAGEVQAARKGYFSIIQQYPNSRFIPLAYLAFGELFATEARSDPSKWQLARLGYLEVLKYPLPDNQAYSYAMLRLAQATAGENDHTKALASYKRAMESTLTAPGAICAASVSSAAREGLVESYAEVGRPDRAAAFLQAAGPEHVAELTIGLSRAYARRGQTGDAAVVLRDALLRAPDPALCAEARELLANRGAAGVEHSILSGAVQSSCQR